MLRSEKYKNIKKNMNTFYVKPGHMKLLLMFSASLKKVKKKKRKEKQMFKCGFKDKLFPKNVQQLYRMFTNMFGSTRA